MDIKSWLQTVLQHYEDPKRTFQDVNEVLERYSTLKPKMDTFTSNNGHTQLLLCLNGTVPILYRSISYNIPVAFWVPKEYPNISPIPYVKPTANMYIRESQYVDRNGMCYHEYRSDWKNKYTFLELIIILQRIFEQEPPVYNKVSHSQSLSSMESSTLYNINQGVQSINLNKSNSFPVLNRRDMLYKKLLKRQENHDRTISLDMDKLLVENKALNEGESMIEKEYRELLETKERILYNKSILEKKSTEIDAIINQLNSMPDIPIDETLFGMTIVSNQLFDLVADDHAISDTIYFLSKALQNERINLPTFMKYTRTLSREQFMKRALIKKISEKV